jgi:quercetin dioxygenase-like cupin family protein
MTIRTPSNACLLRPEELTTYERGGGARTTPLINKEVGTQSFITGYTSFEGGAVIPFHSHNCQESVVLMEGEAMMDIDGLEYQLKPHDVTFIPPNVSHRFRNLSKTNPMKILWIYENTAATRTLTETGATAPVSAEHIKK